MQRWKIIGILATLVIVLALPLYIVQESRRTGTPPDEQPATFVTSRASAKCHKKEYEEWQNSHHAKSMAVAAEETVLGDFNDAVFEKDGVSSRFYRKDGGYFVHTQGMDGKMAEFQISHTFGWYPLQQYLIPFPDGRLQCLPIAWDVQEKNGFISTRIWFWIPGNGSTGPTRARTGIPCARTVIPRNCGRTTTRRQAVMKPGGRNQRRLRGLPRPWFGSSCLG